MRLSRGWLLLVAAVAVPSVLADVKFVTPAAGGTLGSGAVTITWTDSGSSPAITDLSAYILKLYVGGNEPDSNAIPVAALTSTGAFAGGNSFTATIDPTVAGPTANGFYLQMTSTAKDGGTIINYSGRFSIPSMTGTTPTTYETAAQAVTGTAGPDTQNNLANNAGAAAGAATGADGAFGVPYALQTGLTKYAPMQSVPPTKITLKNFTPLYPSSSYSIATTWLPKPTIVTTVTQSQTFSVESMVNTAPAQSQPTGDMAKFLNRWKD